jgi:hypothetical protein
MSASSVVFSETKANDRVGADGQFGVVTINLQAVFHAVKDEVNPNGPLHSMISHAYSLQAAVDGVTAAINANSLTVAEAEWETAREAARSALESYNTANAQELRYRNALQKAIDERTNAISHFNALKESKPNPKTYPSPAEIKKWEDSVSAAQRVVDEKAAEFLRASETTQLYYSDLNRMGAALNAASDREAQLRLKVHTLKGVANTAPDSQTGLKERLA